MVKSVSLAAIHSIESGFRKVVLPLVLLAASLLRYNVISLLYFTCMLASIFLPSTRKKNKIPNIILTVFLGLISLFMTVAQLLFQIHDELSPCSSAERIWRQFGFIKFKNAKSINRIRYLAPDVIVLILSFFSSLFIILIVIIERKSKRRKAEKLLDTSYQASSVPHEPGLTANPGADTSNLLTSNGALATSENNVLHQLHSAESSFFSKSNRITTIVGETTESKEQKKGGKLNLLPNIPTAFLLSITWKSLFMLFLWFSGVCVASVLNSVYFICSILICLCWALHFNQIRFFMAAKSFIPVLVALYSAIHLIILYLYQFQSAQELVPRFSLTARIIGLTGILRTNCSANQTHKLLSHHSLEWPIYVNPISLLILFWLSASAVRHQLKVKPRGRHRRNYNPQPTELQIVAFDDKPDDETAVIKETAWMVDDSQNSGLIYDGLLWLARSFIRASFVFTLFAMMVWSIAFPSWTSFVLLMWSCIVWVTPRFNAKDIMYYTTPLLVFYAIVLLLIQYLYNLDLTEDELESHIDAGLIRYSPVGARVLAIVIKSICTGVFMCSLFALISNHKSQWYTFLQCHFKSSRGITLETGLMMPMINEVSTDQPPNPKDDHSKNLDASILTMALRNVVMPSDPYKYLKQYWILVTIGAFLLVILVGEVTLFQVVFMIFFLLFLLAYEFFPNYWYKIMEPLWTILILYAFLELTAIYTYQFSSVRKVWIDALNSTNDGPSVGKILNSIGLVDQEVSVDDLESVQNLFAIIVPSAVFVAVMALQLKYFDPQINPEDQARRQLRHSGAAQHRQLSFLKKGDSQIFNDAVKLPQLELSKGETETAEVITDNIRGDVSSEEARRKHIQEKIEKYWNVAYTAINIAIELLWRLLEVYLPKAIIFVLFALIIDKISASNFLVQAILVVAIPIQVNSVMYFILTGLISCLAVLKMLYQVELVDTDTFRFSTSCLNAVINASTPRGKIFPYNYDQDDPGWLGFQKAECQHCNGFSDYIKYDIIVLLLLALYYTVTRRQKRCLGEIQIPVEDKRALFWGITSEEADQSVIKGVGYFINHVFDFYGLEISWCMIAIAVAVRTDIFGVLYAIVLGVFLLAPRKILKVAWIPYVMVHGCLLLIQYAMLVNVPYGACIDDQVGHKTLPWNGIKPVGLKRWLWLPIANNEYSILNKDWLWADLLIYVVICAQLRNFKKTQVEDVDISASDYVAFFPSQNKLAEVAGIVKRIMHNYFVWVSLFIVFVAGTIQVSLLGIFYLFAAFLLLWVGQILHIRKAKLRKQWFILLLVIWLVLLVKISLQLYTCVYFENEINKNCTVVRLFNSRCEAQSYYDPPQLINRATNKAVCEDLPKHVGIWVDSLAFVIVTIQILIFSTNYENVRNDLKLRLEEAEHATSDLLEKINEELENTRIREKIIREGVTKRLLEVQSKYNTSVVEHYLRAGVQLPDHIEFNDENPIELQPQLSVPSQDLPSSEHDRASLLSDMDIHQSLNAQDTHEDVHKCNEIVKSKYSTAESIRDAKHKSLFQGIWKLIGNSLTIFDSGFVLVIEWLSNRSLYFRYLSKKRKERRERPSLGVSQPQHDISAPVTETALGEPRRNSCDGSSIKDKFSISTQITNDDEIQTEVDGILGSHDDASNVWKRIVGHFMQFFMTLYYALVANTDRICYFFIVMNLIVNGSVLSLVYAALMFLWGLLSVPWPTRRFWLTMIFYTMFVILVKYGFQFHDINWPMTEHKNLYWPDVLGVAKRKDFLGNVVWDLLLLISLFFHRSLLIDTGRWKVASEGFLDILPFTGADGTNAIRLIFRPWSQLLSKINKEDDDMNQSTSVQQNSREKLVITKSYSRSESEVEDDEPGILSHIMKVVLVNVKFFYRQIVTQDISLGAHDYYTISFLMDAIAFIIIVLGFSCFGLGSQRVNTVATYIQENNIPWPFVIMLFAHFMLMVIDRAIYLRKSVVAKLIFFLLQLLAWHIWLFFVLPLPSVTDKSFTGNPFAQALYFFKAQYFILSAQQCVSGFPKRVLGYFISKHYNLFASLTFQGYRLIPILPDLKEIMDWMFTDTSLKLFHWLKVQEIWAQLYLIKNLRKREKSNPRVLGQLEGLFSKLLFGGGLLVLFILLIWGPLFAISAITATNARNPPIEVSIQLQLGSFEPIVTKSAENDSIHIISESQYNNLIMSPAERLDFRKIDFTTVIFEGNSTALWDISPDSRKALNKTLSNFTLLIFSWQITRQLQQSSASLVSETVSGRLERNLTWSEAEEFSDVLTQSSGVVTLRELYPKCIYAPGSGASVDFTDRFKKFNCSRLDANITLHNRSITDSVNQEWWTLSPNDSSDMVVIIYSNSINLPIFSFISSKGIIGLYASVVLAISAFLRSYIAALPSRITFNEIPNPDGLLRLCEDIFYVREDGNHQDEEILVGRLFYIFRSPTRLIQQTKWKKD